MSEDVATQFTLVTFGLFFLASGRRLAVTRKNARLTSSGNAPQTFNFYTTSIPGQCPDHISLPAELRVYSPRDDVTLTDGTIAITVTKGHFPDAGNVLLDAISVFPFSGDPTNDE